MTNNKNQKVSFIINDRIKYLDEVRAVGEGLDGIVMKLDDARKLAEERGEDVVLINYKVKPAIVRICDYQKFLYEYKKKMKKQSSPQTQVKEVQLSVSIAQHDLETKAHNAQKFIEQGHKVKVVLTMKGREMDRREENKRSLYTFIELMSDVAIPEAQPKDEGKKTIVVLKKKKKG